MANLGFDSYRISGVTSNISLWLTTTLTDIKKHINRAFVG
ncbi:uncharacterized protein RAG0_02473 [Rhynchosporium agropyri]|uniref:Uncharacterized protein n=2 Tax=Rhynchosporium TaxID=38037 RepID=A0A1E1MBU2_RHYSE|nr:uncharacterized protein RAG0_02473 [Rhynchosporium agropyri]CZT46553.1 uncharacterized protein RSE6_06996 [Rhynchosporium secalis]